MIRLRSILTLLFAFTSCSSTTSPSPTPQDAGDGSKRVRDASQPPHDASEADSDASTGAPDASTHAAPVSPSAIPLGDGHISSSPRSGYVYSCTTNFRVNGAEHSGSWIDATTSTWDATMKPTVQGSVAWPTASNSFTVSNGTRTIVTNGLPKGLMTGTFPIAASDPAYQYDRNPNAISPQSFMFALPASPTAAAKPSCVGLGPIGVTTAGVLFFDALDDAGRDAAAHEVQDRCDGHPQSTGIYHFHSISSCIVDKTKTSEPSTLVGYAMDGYGLYVERDSNGNLITNADLDPCHGRTSKVMWDGEMKTMYHYAVTREYPYTLGCFHGTPLKAR